MLIKGVSGDDLAGTGIVTRQRWAVPIWLSILALIFATLLRVLAAVVAWSLRHPVTATIIATQLVLYRRCGLPGVLAFWVLVLVIAVGWAWGWPAAWERLVICRVRGWWRWQTRYRRLWYPALHGSGLVRMTPDREALVPPVALILSTPVVDTLHVRLLHGHTPADLAAKAEGLRHSFGVHRAVVVEDAPGRIRIVLYSRDTLTAAIHPIDPANVPDLRALPVGLSEDGTPYRLRLLGRHILIAGASDSGKGSVLWSIIRALAPAVRSGTVELQGIDPKRMELVFAPDMFTRLETTIPGAVSLLEANVARMQERQDRMSGLSRQHKATPADPAVVIPIDELASLTAYCTDRDAKKRIEAALSLLLSQGRAAGFYVIGALQDPRKEIVQFRDLFTARICLRVTEASHVNMVLGDSALERGATAHLIPDTLPGIGYVYVEGAKEAVRARFTWITDTDLADMAARWPAPRPAGHAKVIDLRDHTGRVPEPRNTPASERSDGGELA